MRKMELENEMIITNNLSFFHLFKRFLLFFFTCKIKNIIFCEKFTFEAISIDSTKASFTCHLKIHGKK